MLIAIDWDFTITADGSLWSGFIDNALRHGHKIIIVTSRSKFCGISDREFHMYLDFYKYYGVIPIVYANQRYKREAAKYAGYEPDIWIDDMPEVIGPYHAWEKLLIPPQQ